MENRQKETNFNDYVGGIRVINVWHWEQEIEMTTYFSLRRTYLCRWWQCGIGISGVDCTSLCICKNPLNTFKGWILW
jgi:hypothetical protein